MFIQLNNKSLKIYGTARKLTKEIYRLSILLPAEEKFNMVQQVRRAALSVKLNLAEGCSRKSPAERKRYLVISRGSIIEIDAALETAVDLNYYKKEDLAGISELLNKSFAMICKMID